MSDENPTETPETSATPLEGFEMELRGRVTLLEEHSHVQDQILTLLSITVICIAVLIVVRTAKR